MTVLCSDIDIDSCSLHSGVQLNVSCITDLCPDVDKDRNILRSEVCVDRKFLNLLRILCSDVDIDLRMSHR